jgi:hypothetical protein
MPSLSSTNKQQYYTFSFIDSPKIEPELQGNEGKKISKEIQKIKKDQPIVKLLLELERINDKDHQKMWNYLQSLSHETENKCDKSVINISIEFWKKLKDHFKSRNVCLNVPDACLGYNHNLMFVWSNQEHYLECEIFSNQQIEFFYRNRNTNAVWGEDIEFNNHKFSDDILAKLSFFTW